TGRRAGVASLVSRFVAWIDPVDCRAGAAWHRTGTPAGPGGTGGGTAGRDRAPQARRGFSAWLMSLFNIDPHNDDMGRRVKEAKNFLELVRRSGNALEPDHFPRPRRRPRR